MFHEEHCVKTGVKIWCGLFVKISGRTLSSFLYGVIVNVSN